MEHRQIRGITHEICGHFYMRIKDLHTWGEVNEIAQEYHERYKENELAGDLLRAFVQEWWRCNKGEEN